MSNVTPLTALPLLALLLSASAATAKQRAADPKAPEVNVRDFLTELLTTKCDDATCERCHPAPAAKAESSAADNIMASAGFSQPEAAAQQEEVRASGGVSIAACRAVGLVDADTGAAALLKGTAAAFITCLEDVRDGLLPGTAERATTEAHIAAVVRACSFAISERTPNAS